MSRALCVDATLVAAEEQESLVACIGCDKDKASAPFFAGGIDDVRVYNRAVRP